MMMMTTTTNMRKFVFSYLLSNLGPVLVWTQSCQTLHSCQLVSNRVREKQCTCMYTVLYTLVWHSPRILSSSYSRVDYAWSNPRHVLYADKVYTRKTLISIVHHA